MKKISKVFLNTRNKLYSIKKNVDHLKYCFKNYNESLDYVQIENNFELIFLELKEVINDQDILFLNLDINNFELSKIKYEKWLNDLSEQLFFLIVDLNTFLENLK